MQQQAGSYLSIDVARRFVIADVWKAAAGLSVAVAAAGISAAGSGLCCTGWCGEKVLSSSVARCNSRSDTVAGAAAAIAASTHAYTAASLGLSSSTATDAAVAASQYVERQALNTQPGLTSSAAAAGVGAAAGGAGGDAHLSCKTSSSTR